LINVFRRDRVAPVAFVNVLMTPELHAHGSDQCVREDEIFNAPRAVA
jgi:hypothetical protein